MNLTPGVARLCDGRYGTSYTDEEVEEFGIDVLVAPGDQEFDILNDLQDGSALIERLRRHARSIAIVDAVVPALKDHAKTLFKLINCRLARSALIGIRQCDVIGW